MKNIGLLAWWVSLSMVATQAQTRVRVATIRWCTTTRCDPCVHCNASPNAMEGHGWSLDKNEIDFWTRVESFLSKSLKP